MEQRGLTRRDLERILGGRGRVSEVLNRRRALSVEMMRRLHRELAIPAESFFSHYAVAKPGEAGGRPPPAQASCEADVAPHQVG